jgi:glycosyltransferase involved in cell wall biosynthesis
MNGLLLAGTRCSRASSNVQLDRARVGRYMRAAARWSALLIAPRNRRPGVRVFYGHDGVPAAGEAVAGGSAKFQRLAARFPNSPTDFTLLYVGSTWLPRDVRPLLRLTERRGIPVVLNQNGVAYPGWAGAETDMLNRRNRHVLDAARHVLYQSEFSKRSADEFVGEPSGTWEVLYNAVDVDRFVPAARPVEGGPVLILYGDQTQAYRLELALRTFAFLRETSAGARLIVTGRLVSDPQPLIDELTLRAAVEFTGRYTQDDAPSLLQRAHVLLHTKVKDPCPSSVIEAMACGIPVVYPASGGTLELVGEEAGRGVPHPDGWEHDVPPTPDALAAAVTAVLEDRASFAERARRRAVERFALGPWLERHATLFDELVR